MIAPLVALYVQRFGLAIWPEMLAILTMRMARLRHICSASHVDAQAAIPVCRRGVQPLADETDGAVDQKVHTAPFCRNGIRCSPASVPIGDVEWIERGPKSFRPELPRHTFTGLGVNVENGDGSAFHSKFARGRFPNAGRASRYDRHPARPIHFGHFLSRADYVTSVSNI
jgi:hypothetical protein